MRRHPTSDLVPFFRPPPTYVQNYATPRACVTLGRYVETNTCVAQNPTEQESHMALILGAELGMGSPIFGLPLWGVPLIRTDFWGVYIGDPYLAKLRKQGAWGICNKTLGWWMAPNSVRVSQGNPISLQSPDEVKR